MKHLRILLLVLFGLCSSPCLAAELGGHFKSLNFYQDSVDENFSHLWLSANSLRLDLSDQLSAGTPNWEVALEQLTVYQDPAGSLPLPDRSINRIDDLAWDGRPDRSLSWQLQVDRLNLQWDWGDTVVTVGRQGIGFGRINLVSPLDIIAPFSPTAFDTEVRPGVDALRYQQFFSVVGELGTTLVTGENNEQSTLLADLTLNAGHIDVLLIGGQLRDRPMLGFGLAGPLGGMGWKLEWAGYQGHHAGELGGDPDDQFSIAGCELEYLFSERLLVQLEYLYNGAGSSRVADYPLIAQSAPLQEGLSYLYGKHYLLTGLSWDVTPLLRASSLLIYNFDDDSSFLRPQLDLSLADNISLELFCSFYQGDKPYQFAGITVPRSEFGSLGDSGGFFFKLYF